jgi:hypothetical protein
MQPAGSGSAASPQGGARDAAGEGSAGGAPGSDGPISTGSPADVLPPHLSTARHFSEARGGGFFFLSADGRYMVKSITRAEHNTLLALLPHYCRHVRDHRRSLICRISGCYSITMYGQTKVRGLAPGRHRLPPLPQHGAGGFSEAAGTGRDKNGHGGDRKLSQSNTESGAVTLF